jgi:predicted DNA-binding protein (MmcQ/YjbR family)
VVDRPQLNVFGPDARKRVHKRLREWYPLTRKIERLKILIEKDTAELKRLDARLSVSIVPNYESMDMPRGTDISDSTGNLAASLIDRRNKLKFKILELEMELTEATLQLHEIETAVEQLNPRDADIVRRYYLLNERWESICYKKRIQKSRFYEVLDRVLDLLADRL